MDNLDQVNRRKVLIADLKKLASGWRPDATTLATAPVIDNWYADFYPDSRDVCLVGVVSGHPVLGNQIITTSPLVAIDPQYRWARTHGRFYQLARRAAFRVVDTDASGGQIIDV